MPSLTQLRFAQREDTERLSPGDAVRAAHARMDAAVAESPQAGQWACALGCASCCHLKVEVTRAEAALIASAVSVPVERLRETAERAEGLTAEQYRLAQIRCALLDDEDRCTVYEVRPLRCRSHVSLSRTACERAFAGDEPVPSSDPWLTRVADALHAGLEETSNVELHRALLDLQ